MARFQNPSYFSRNQNPNCYLRDNIAPENYQNQNYNQTRQNVLPQNVQQNPQISHQEVQNRGFYQNRHNIESQNPNNERNTMPIFFNQNPVNDRVIINNQQARPRETFLRRLRNIPKFNGESFSQLREFIDVVDTLYMSCTNGNEENELYEQIMLQVRGEPRNVIMNLNNLDWPTIKENLLTEFAYLANKEILTSQLENIRQYSNESLYTYADRVRNLLKDKNATHSYMTEEQKKEHNRLARRSFSRGLSDFRLRNRLLTRGASSLEDAVAYAIEAESDETNYIPSSELFCIKCNANGHRQKDCQRQNNNNSNMGKLISALRAITGQNNPMNLNHRAVFMTDNSNTNRNINDSRYYNWNQANNYQNRNWNQNSNTQDRNWNMNPSSENRNWGQDRYRNQNADSHANRNYNNNNFNNDSNDHYNGCKKRRLNESFKENNSLSVTESSEPEADSSVDNIDSEN